MGLDTTHDAWHGAYSAFSRWRDTLAKAAGYWVAPIKFDDGITRDTIIIDWGHVTPANNMGEWDETPADPLVVLITHSDCEGAIHPEQAGPLADRLEELLPALEGKDGGGHIGNYVDKTQTFIDGLRAAVEAGEPVEFF